MRELGRKLRGVVDAAEPELRRVTSDDSAVPVREGGWSRRQILGHLVDSASNNHQRFVRAALQDSLEFPGYDQRGNVRVQAGQEANWGELVALWAAYNRYLAHVIAHLPENKLNVMCRIGSDEPVTLAFLAEDYLRHLVHHLEQMGIGRAN